MCVIFHIFIYQRICDNLPPTTAGSTSPSPPPCSRYCSLVAHFLCGAAGKPAKTNNHACVWHSMPAKFSVKRPSSQFSSLWAGFSRDGATIRIGPAHLWTLIKIVAWTLHTIPIQPSLLSSALPVLKNSRSLKLEILIDGFFHVSGPAMSWCSLGSTICAAIPLKRSHIRLQASARLFAVTVQH